MRRINVVVGLLFILAFTGCKQPCDKDGCDSACSLMVAGVPDNLLTQPANTIEPDFSGQGQVPRIVTDPNRPPKYLSLAECIAMALEKGATGQSAGSGLYNDSLRSWDPASRSFSGSDSNRVLALNPAIIAADIEASMAKFDAQWFTNMNWQTTDQQVTNQLGVGGATVINTQQATFNTGLVKYLPSGGTAGLTFSTAYEMTNLPAQINPSYNPKLQFSLEQPLLQLFGTEINQLLQNHPGSNFVPGATQFNFGSASGYGQAKDGILLTRLRFDQSRAEFEREESTKLLNVERAYWNLYSAYGNLYSIEQAMVQALEAWRINKDKFDAGTLSIADLAQSRAQYELFRTQRLAALGSPSPGSGQLVGVLETERNLRGLIGLPPEDGCRIVPTDAPTLAPYKPDWNACLHDALTLRRNSCWAGRTLSTSSSI